MNILLSSHVWRQDHNGFSHQDPGRFHLVADVIDRVLALGARAAYVKQALRDKLLEHKAYIQRYGEDMPEIRNWQWKGQMR